MIDDSREGVWGSSVGELRCEGRRKDRFEVESLWAVDGHLTPILLANKLVQSNHKNRRPACDGELFAPLPVLWAVLTAIIRVLFDRKELGEKGLQRATMRERWEGEGGVGCGVGTHAAGACGECGERDDELSREGLKYRGGSREKRT